MTTLITLLTSGKNTWKYFFKLINSANWDKVILFANSFNLKKLKLNDERVKVFEIDFSDKIETTLKIKQIIEKEVENKFDVVVNLFSGFGNEHMLLLAAMMLAGCSINFVLLDNDSLLILPNDAIDDAENKSLTSS